MSSSPRTAVPSIDELVRRLLFAHASDGELPDPSTPMGRLTRELFASQWQQARDGLLARSKVLRVDAPPSPSPYVFRFEIDRPFKRRAADGSVEIAPGPIRGSLRYRPDVLEPRRGEPSVLAFVDRELRFFHPNCLPHVGLLCLGDLPAGPYPLEETLQQLYRVASYGSLGTESALDSDAVRYFLENPDAFDGLRPVPPLW